MDCIKGHIIYADMLSNKPKLRTNEKSIRFKTIYGGALTIVSIILIICAGVNFAINLFTRKNSSITYNLLPATTSTKADFGKFPFMVALLDNGLKLLEDEDRYYTFLSEVWNFVPNNSSGNIVMDLIREPIITERCDLEKHFGEYKEYFKHVPYLNHHFCLVPGQNITTFGLYGSTVDYNFVDHWISTCVNDTKLNRTNCFPAEKSKARLVNTYISYVFLDYSIDHNDIHHPVKVNLRSEILPVSSSIYKRIFFYQRPVTYTTDYGFVFEDLQDITFYQTLDSKENVDLRPQGTVPGSFALISVMMDKYDNFYARKYSKIQNFLADVGGLVKGLLLISSCMNYLLSEEFYYVDLVNSLYKVEVVPWMNKNMSSKDKEGIFHSYNMSSFNLQNYAQQNISAIKRIPFNDFKFKSIDETIKQKNINHKNIRPNEEIQDAKESQFQNSNSNINEVLKTQVHRKLSIKLDFWQIVLPHSLFKSKSENLNHYKIVKNYILRMISLKEIIKKNMELEKLKCFLFDNDLIEIYENTLNPNLLKIKKDTSNIWLESHFSKEILKGINFDKKINNIRNKYEKSLIERNILRILECNNKIALQEE